MTKQTAVDFLLSELGIEKLIEIEKLPIAAEVVRQAKEMQKNQIMDDFSAGWNWAKYLNGKDKKDPLEYYNQTYNK